MFNIIIVIIIIILRNINRVIYIFLYIYGTKNIFKK